MKIWQILDFKKMIDDGNNINTEENLDNFYEYYMNCLKGKKTHSKPIISFKKIIRSPEYQMHEYSRASDL